MATFSEVKIGLLFLIGIVHFSSIAARPSPQGGNELQFSSFSQIPQTLLDQLSSDQVENLKKTLSGGGGGTIGGGGGGGNGGVRTIGGGGGGGGGNGGGRGGGSDGGNGGGRGGGSDGDDGGNGHRHVHHTHHTGGGGGGGDGETHVHRTRGPTETRVHRFGGGGGADVDVDGNGGGGFDTGGKGDVGPGVNNVPKAGGVGEQVDLTSGKNTVPKGVDADTSNIQYQPPAKYGSFINEGKSFLANTDVRRRNICNRGLIDKTAHKLRNGLTNGVDQLQGGIEKLTQGGNILGPIGGIVNAVGKGVKNLANNALDGVDFGIQDAACGLGNIADDAAKGLGSGNLFSEVGKGVKEFFGGLGNIAEDVGEEAAEGVGRAASNLKSGLSKLDGGKKTQYSESSPH